MSDLSGPPPDGDVNRGSLILIVGWLECAVAAGFLGGRIYARNRVTRAMGPDDWLMIVSFILALTFVCIATPEVHYGTGRHVYYLNDSQSNMAIQLNWVTQAFHIMSTCIGKISIVCFILRIIGKKGKTVYCLVGLVSLLFLISVICVAFIFAQCSPAAALWDPLMTGKCWNPSIQQDFGFLTASYSVFSDVVLAIFPITVLWDLQMNVRTKVSLGMVMGLGVFAAGAAIVKTFQLKTLSSRGDYTFDTVDLIIWMMTEQFVIIIAACIPPMRHLFMSSLAIAPADASSGRRRAGYSGSGFSRGTKGYYLSESENDMHHLNSLARPGELSNGGEGQTHVVANHSRGHLRDRGSRSRLHGDDDDSLVGILPATESDGIVKTTKVNVSYETQEPPMSINTVSDQYMV